VYDCIPGKQIAGAAPNSNDHIICSCAQPTAVACRSAAICRRRTSARPRTRRSVIASPRLQATKRRRQRARSSRRRKLMKRSGASARARYQKRSCQRCACARTPPVCTEGIRSDRCTSWSFLWPSRNVVRALGSELLMMLCAVASARSLHGLLVHFGSNQVVLCMTVIAAHISSCGLRYPTAHRPCCA
jgi:hypothetical protein